MPFEQRGPSLLQVAALPGSCPLPARPDEAFDRFARLVRAQLDVPVSLVSLVSRTDQVFPGALGLPEPWQSTRRTPLSHSVCQYVVATERPLVLPDVRRTPQLADNLAGPELGVVAYAGVPLHDADGRVVGSLCAIDTRPREWTADDEQVLADLGAACSSELALRQLRRRAEDATAEAAIAHRAEADAAARLHTADQRYRLLLALSEGLSTAGTVEALVLAVSGLAHEHLGTDHAGIAVRPLGTDRLSYRTVDPFSDAASAQWADIPLDGATPAGIAALSGQAQYYSDHEAMLAASPYLRGRPVVEGRGARAALPLSIDGGTVGAIFLGWPQPRDFEVETRAAMAGLGRYTAQAVARAQLLAQRRGVAETLQRSLLTELPELDHLQLHARYEPAADTEEVGGDWYDAVVMPDGATTLVIGDVVGHDMRAAAQMGQLRSLTRAMAWAFEEPASEVLTRVDQAMAGLAAPGAVTMATALVARIEQDEADAAAGLRRLRWSSAGHPPPLLVHQGRASYLPGDSDLLLGAFPGAVRHDHLAELAPGSTVLLFTDGLFERRGRSLSDGLEVLRLSAQRHAGRGLPDLVDAVLIDLLDGGSEHDAPTVGLEPDLVPATDSGTGRRAPVAASHAGHGDDVAVLAVRFHPEDDPRRT